MRKIFLLALLCISVTTYAQKPQYTKADSIKVINLLKSGKKQNANTNMMIFFARQLKNIPYVVQTLEVNNHEQLIINLRQLDCTTYVENVLALTLCEKNHKYDFKDFYYYLKMIRYEGGNVSYTKRLHYFSNWISDNTKLGFVKERVSEKAPFTAIQQLNINYMSKNWQNYPMLKQHPSWIKEISSMENKLNGKCFRYIPKSDISNTSLIKNNIKSGDIIAIITNKKGLDTSHIGIATWHKDGLHLLNASQIHKKVVEEPMLLRTYMQKHPSQIGIRVICVVRN